MRSEPPNDHGEAGARAASTLGWTIRAKGEWFRRTKTVEMAKRRCSTAGCAALLPVPLSACQGTAAAPGTEPARGGSSGSLPEAAPLSRFALELEEYASFPKSDPDPLPTDPRLQRQARINY